MQTPVPADESSISLVRSSRSDSRVMEWHNLPHVVQTYNSISQLEDATPEVCSPSEWCSDLSFRHHEVRLEADPRQVSRTLLLLVLQSLQMPALLQILRLTSIWKRSGM